MNSLVKLELKKIFSIKAVIVVCCLCIVYIFVLLIGGIKVKEHYSEVDKKNKRVHDLYGFDAVKAKKGQLQGNEGYLDENKIKEVINYYISLKSNKENLDKTDNTILSEFALSQFWSEYYDISNLITMSYSMELNKYEGNIIDTLNEDRAKDFYTNRNKKILDYINSSEAGLQLNKNEKDTVVKLSEKMNTPLKYDYYDGWQNLLNKLFYINLIVILVVCFGIAFAFTMEFEDGMMIIILSTVNGKGKLLMAKIKAIIFFSTSIFLGMNLIYLLLTFVFYGTSGWDSYIQIESSNWLSLYNLKFYQAYILGLAVGLSICIFMAVLTLLFTCMFKKAVLSISISSAILLAPLLISSANKSNLAAMIIELLPIKALNYTIMLRQFSFYNIFGFTIQRCYLIPVFFILLTVLLVPFNIRAYKKIEL